MNNLKGFFLLVITLENSTTNKYQIIQKNTIFII